VLHKEDPELWTPHALSRQFGVPLANMQAMLALQQLEAGGFALDPELQEIADDVEDYLLAEEDIDDAERAAVSSSVLQLHTPDVGLEKMSGEQEERLIRAVAERFQLDGTETVQELSSRLDTEMDVLVRSLQVGELKALCRAVEWGGEAEQEERAAQEEQVEAGSAGEADTAGTASDAATTQGAENVKGMVGAASNEAVAEEHGAAQASGEERVDRSTLLGLLSSSLSADVIDGPADGVLERIVAATRNAHGSEKAAPILHVEARQDAQAREAAEASAVIDVGVTTINPRGMPVFVVEDDVGGKPEAYLPKGLLNKLRRVRHVDNADRLEVNLRKRSANLASAGQRAKYASADSLVFVDTSERLKSRAPSSSARRVWVSSKEGLREPSEAETRAAMLRVQPPQLLPRIKRNW